MRRGACPTLIQPMQTGDGLLARLAPAHGKMSPRKLKEIALAAELFGNGLVEITARGKLQCRGLTVATAPRFTAWIAALELGIVDGFQVETGPLAGLIASETADPRSLAETVFAGAAELDLAPKVSITVDGCGSLHLGEISADIKLEALTGEEWRIGIGGNRATARWLGRGGSDAVTQAAIAILRKLAEKDFDARARDFGDDEIAVVDGLLEPARSFGSPHAGMDARLRRACPLPVGRFALHNGSDALGFALPFGQTHGATLADFAEAAHKADDIRLAPGGGLLVVGLPRDREAALFDDVKKLGLIIEPTDPRLSITACAGAPFCASAHIDTKALAADVAASGLIYGSRRLHLAGCAKRCAAPGGAQITLIGTEHENILETGAAGVSKTLADLLTRRSTAHRTTPSRKTE